MHEATVVASLLDILTDLAGRHGLGAIRRVRLKVGRLAAVDAEALAACFAICAEGTVAEGAELAIERVPVRVRCHDCGTDGEVAGWEFRCGRCRGDRLDIVGGRELLVDSLET